MSDAAVIADSAPAPAPVEGGAPIADVGANFTAPLGSQIPPDAVAKPADPAKPASIDASLDRAIAKSAEKAAKPDVKAEPKEPVKAEQPRENGKFAPKDSVKAPVADSAVAVDSAKPAEAVKPSHTAEDAPARFTETAKAKWAAADPEIRGETLRMQKELTDGYQKYRAAAERDTALNEFHEEAKQAGKELHGVVREYRNMEKLLHSNPEAGIEAILGRVGLTPRQYAEHVLNQTPDQVAGKQDATISELKREIAALKDQVGGVTQTFKQQQEQSTLTEINKFASENPRFEELADDIAFFMQSGRAKDLPEAYQLAERLNPAPVKAAEPAASSAALDPPVHPDKGQKSINGAPSAGSTLQSGKKRVALSIDESLNRAFGHG